MRNGPDTKLHREAFGYLEMSLRLLVIPLTVASLWVTAKNKQVSDVYGQVEFSNFPGLKYFVWISAISAGYALASLVISFLGCFPSDWIFFAMDQVASYLMVTSGSAVGEVLYLAKKGDQSVSWSEVCGYSGRFCNKMRVSLAVHFLALVCFIALSLISSHRVFSMFEAPCVDPRLTG